MTARTIFLVLLSTALLLLSACQAPAASPTQAPQLVEATSAPSPTASPPLPTATNPPPTASPAPPTATPLPTEIAAAPSATATTAPAAAAPEEEPLYQVVYVASDDELNLRAGPGVQNEVVARLAPGATGIEVTGSGEMVGDYLWLPVSSDSDSGWVNSLYLAEMVPDDAFCESEAVAELLDNLQEAIANEDADALSELVHPGRGLRIHTYWWNPEVRLEGEALDDLFLSDASYEWGVEDGSGRSIVGSFADVILPLLQRDLLPATETACNEIIHGGTAGIVQLPPPYEGLNHYSFYRAPAPGAVEMDWGTWVVGIERWQGEYYISFLVHYQWEI